MSRIRAARIHTWGEPFEVIQINKPKPGPKDVLVRVEACGLVPNSANVSKGSMPEQYPLPELPSVFGLDAAGVVEAVGDNVFTIRPGDRVYVDPYLTCGTCHQCRRGRIDMCANGCLRAYFGFSEGGKRMLAQYSIGALSQFLLSPDANIAILPKSIDFAVAARFGYLGTSFAGLKKADLGPGKTVVILGVTGTLGYAAVAIALGLGCTKILGIGRNKERMAEVEKLGSHGRVVVHSSEEGDDLAEWILKETNGLGPDALYDCLGVGGDASMTSNLIGLVKRGGKAVLAAGGADGTIKKSYLEMQQKDVAIVGTTWFTSAHVDEMMTLIDMGVIDLSFLQHKFFSLDEVNDAFDCVGNRLGGAVNVVVEPQK